MQEIRHVSIGKFQRNIYKELKDIPFIVTKDGKDYFVVITASSKIKLNLYGKNMIELPKDNIANSYFESETSAHYRNPDNKLLGLNPLPEDGTNLAVSQTGKCEVPNSNCKNIGKGYRVTFMTDTGQEKKELFLCD